MARNMFPVRVEAGEHFALNPMNNSLLDDWGAATRFSNVVALSLTISC